MRRSFFQNFLFIALIAVTLPFISRTATANPSALTEAAAYFRTGRYPEALSLFQKADDADKISGVIGASRTLVMTGRYAAAEALSLIHISEPTRPTRASRMPSSA